TGAWTGTKRRALLSVVVRLEIRLLFANDLIQSSGGERGYTRIDVIAGFAEDSSLKGQSKRTKAPKAAAAKKASRQRTKKTPVRKRAAASKAEAIEPDPFLLADPPSIERRKSR